MRVTGYSFVVLWATENMEYEIERAARLCYQSERQYDGRQQEFLERIISKGHHSVLEHGVISVQFVMDRGLTHELVRHRLASFSQESTRYCNYGGKDIECIPPRRVGAVSPLADIWTEAMRSAERYYNQMLEAGASPQVARSVLPNSLKAEIVMTCNVREWRHVLALRTGEGAHPDLQGLMKGVLRHFRGRWPVLFGDLRPQ